MKREEAAERGPAQPEGAGAELGEMVEGAKYVDEYANRQRDESR